MNTSDKKRDIKSGAVEFPQFPGEDCLAHTASTYHLSRAARRAFRVTAFDVPLVRLRGSGCWQSPKGIPPGERWLFPMYSRLILSLYLYRITVCDVYLVCQVSWLMVMRTGARCRAHRQLYEQLSYTRAPHPAPNAKHS